MLSHKFDFLMATFPLHLDLALNHSQGTTRPNRSVHQKNPYWNGEGTT